MRNGAMRAPVVARAAALMVLLGALGLGASVPASGTRSPEIFTNRVIGGVLVAAPSHRSVAHLSLFAATPDLLPSTGGTVVLRGEVVGKATCAISSSPSTAGLPRTAACSASRTVSVNVPANLTGSAKTWRFDLAVSSRSTTERASVTVRVDARSKPHAPVITGQPASQTVASGARALFVAAASGTPTPEVSWQRSTNEGTTWHTVAGADARTLGVVASVSDNGEEYRARFTNRLGTATTGAATLTVTAPAPSSVAPTVIEDPVSETVSAGSTATFAAAASGSPLPAVQWSVSSNGGSNFEAIPGADSDTLSFTATSPASGDEYEATFTNSAGSATTPAASLTVTPSSPSTSAPTVTANPVDATVVLGSSATFTAAASGTPTPTVQWSVSTNGGSSFTPITGTDSDTLSFTATTAASGDEYEATFTNSAGSATTTPATLTVTEPVAVVPSVTSEPVSQSVVSGTTVTFSATASGTPTPTVQWSVSSNGGSSFSAITGATADSYSLVASSGLSGDEYEATFTNSAGSTTTTPATLTVSSPASGAPVVTEQPTSTTVPATTTASFTAAASGATSLQWQISTNGGASWGAIAGATSDTYSFTATTGESGDEYEALFSDSSGSVSSEAVTLTVTPAPSLASNWSGYAATGSTFSAVTGSWTVPTVTCSGRGSLYSSQWIGIDGYSSSTVEQDGTEADCIGGSPSYDAWYEMFGDNAVNDGYEVELSTGTYPVAPGDSMSASVSLSAGTWTLALDDATKGWSFSVPIASPSPAPAQSSAEWIVERPEVGDSLASLADFGSVTFTGSTATSTSGDEPISSYTDAGIEMYSSSRSGTTILDEPSSLSPNGESFTITYL